MRKYFFSIPFLLILLGIIFYTCNQETNVVEPNNANSVLRLDGCSTTSPTLPVGIVPTTEAFPGGGPTCSGGKRLTPGNGAENIVFNLDGIPGNDVTVVITIGTCGEVMSWNVPDNIVIDKIYMKGGSTRNVYDYTGTTPRPSSDGELHCPTTSSGGYAGIGHIDFCFHYRLNVSKTALPEFTRTYSWTIDKVGDQTALELSQGQTFPVNYEVKVSATYIDSDWKVTGTITIFNNTPIAAVITSISDELSGPVSAILDCGITFPYTLAAGTTLNCTYSADLSGASNGTNTVTVVTSTPMVEGGTATKAYTFGAPTTEFDECIDVSDDLKGPLGTVCYDDAPYTFEYALDIVYNECGEYEYTNTASFVTNNNGVLGDDGWKVAVSVPCVGGCTLTQGYWKTHSEFGPAPYDDTWAQLADGASTTFFLSGQTYYQVLRTPPAGNVYYNLAHQYIAAKLNGLNGADLSAAKAAFDEATTLFNTYTPAQAATLKGKAKTGWTNLATVLDNYNNGLIGPGHCSE
jgi:hypothetical protein